MKQKTRFALLALLFFLVGSIAGYLTKPTESEFEQYAQEQFLLLNADLMHDPVMQDIVKENNAFFVAAIDKLVTSQDAWVATWFTLTLPNGDYHYIGIWGWYIPMQTENPLKKLFR